MSIVSQRFYYIVQRDSTDAIDMLMNLSPCLNKLTTIISEFIFLHLLT